MKEFRLKIHIGEWYLKLEKNINGRRTSISFLCFSIHTLKNNKK